MAPAGTKRFEWELPDGIVEMNLVGVMASLTIRSTKGLEIGVTLKMTPGQLRYLGEHMIKLAAESKSAI